MAMQLRDVKSNPAVVYRLLFLIVFSFFALEGVPLSQEIRSGRKKKKDAGGVGGYIGSRSCGPSADGRKSLAQRGWGFKAE